MPNSRTEPLSLRKNTIWNAFGCFFYLGCQWLTTVLVVVLSDGYANSGALAFGMSTGIIFASIALYKIRTFQVSDLDNEYSGQNYIAFRIITIVSAAVFCLMYLTLATNDSTYLSASLLYLLFKADECFSDVLYGIEQRNERMDYIGKSQIIRGIVSLGGFFDSPRSDREPTYGPCVHDGMLHVGNAFIRPRACAPVRSCTTSHRPTQSIFPCTCMLPCHGGKPPGKFHCVGCTPVFRHCTRR